MGRQDRRLWALTLAVCVLAGSSVALAVTRLALPNANLWMYPVTAATLIAVGNACSVEVPVRSGVRLTLAPTAIFVSAVVLPAPWLVLATVVGVSIAKIITRYPTSAAVHKAIHNTAKDTVAATAVGAAVGVAGVHPDLGSEVLPATVPSYLVALALSVLALVLVEETVTTTTVSVATGRAWRTVASTAVDLRLAVVLAEFVVAAVSIALVKVDLRLMIAMPLAMLLVYAVYNHRMWLRAERETWQRLAGVTDTLSTADPTDVLLTAVRGAVGLFGARHAEVEVTLPAAGRRLVRACPTCVCFDGPPDGVPPLERADVVQPLTTGNADSGAVRIVLHGPRDVLSGREKAALRAFGAALSTSLDNAVAHARLAADARMYAHLATRDGLTGLAGRRAFTATAGPRCADRSADVGVLRLRLVGFAGIAATLGHAAGDLLLVEVATRLKRAVAVAGYLTCRLGVDEFAVLLTGKTSVAMESESLRIAEALRRPADAGGVLVGVQIGIGLAVGAGVGIEELLGRADAALRRGGGNASVRLAVYDRLEDHQDGEPQLAELVHDLPADLRAGRLHVEFQPVLDLTTGVPVAIEAVASWQHPRHGAREAQCWCGIAESVVPPVSITQVVLDEALAGVTAWRDAGFDLPVVVTVSAPCLLDARFTGLLFGSLLRHDVAPDRLILQIPETDLLGPGALVETLTEVDKAGVLLALERFGAGPASLATLATLPIRGLKVDETFIDSMASRHSAVVIRAAVTLGGDLGIPVCAPGVRSHEQRQALRDLGCRVGEGDLLGPAMELDQLLIALGRGVNGVPGQLAAALEEVRVLPLRSRPAS
ncbi:diguanylate cyclase (GGDEF)-like protein [Micromonospora sp. Llam0]|uniref:phosphodiesterase n=1 Tax=Micromonospora sp. Llam0 TaxID=2485143 RepID=UPI000F4A5B3A|nr:phosphodiesterase [Micromonospora sp. Llam0]ROO52797.1 diguanylate cyclase (GGDEF)-like protein [Micromonospora sp. Llam0]